MSNQTPVFEVHKQMGATMVNFGGWEMPIRYTSIIDEHNATRNNAGLFDISHMGEIAVAGAGSEKFIQYLVTNDISALKAGQAIYSPICYENGTIVDDVIIYKFDAECFLLVVNASNAEKDLNWINKTAADFDVEIRDVGPETAEFSIQGPKAELVLQKLTETDLSKIGYFGFAEGDLKGRRALISRTGYTGEDGFELFFHPDGAVELWNAILDAGKDEGVKPVGLGARDTLRLEACLRLYGNEISDAITPLEAGLGWTVKFDKGDFAGKAALQEKSSNIESRLVGFEMAGRAIARHSYEVYRDGAKAGYVTSGTFSPTLQKPVGMAYLDKKYAFAGEEFVVLIRDKRFAARVVSMPLVERRTKNLKI